MPDQKELTVGEMRAMFNGLIHEVRTGLNSAIGFAHIIANDERLPGSTIEDATIIKQSAQNTVAICNDYVEIFRLLSGEMMPEAGPRQPVDLPALVEECLRYPVQEIVARQNERQARQADRFRDGAMDAEELKAIRYVMSLMNQTVEDYFAPIELTQLVIVEQPAALPPLSLRPEALRQTLTSLHRLMVALGGEKRLIQLCSEPGSVQLRCQLNVPRRNRGVVETALAFWLGLDEATPFSHYFENRRVALLALWRQSVPAELRLSHRPDATPSCDHLTIDLVFPTE